MYLKPVLDLQVACQMQLDKNRAEISPHIPKISLLAIPLLSADHSFLLVCAGADTPAYNLNWLNLINQQKINTEEKKTNLTS